MSIHVATTFVTKKLKDGSTKRYRYYQLVRSYREGGKAKTKHLAYLGKHPRISEQRAKEAGLDPEGLAGIKGVEVVTDGSAAAQGTSPDWHSIARRARETGPPLRDGELNLIRQGRKWTVLWPKAGYPFESKRVRVPLDTTEEIAHSEGYDSLRDMEQELRRRHWLHQWMYLYDLTKPMGK